MEKPDSMLHTTDNDQSHVLIDLWDTHMVQQNTNKDTHDSDVTDADRNKHKYMISLQFSLYLEIQFIFSSKKNNFIICT